MCANRRRKVAKYTLDFRLFVEFFGFEFVVEFDNLHRFDVQCRARRRLVVNKSAYRTLEFAFYGNYISVAADGNYAVLQIFVICWRRNEGLQLGFDTVAQTTYALPYCFEFGCCIVGNFGFRYERVENVFFQFLFEVKSRRHFRKKRNVDDFGQRFHKPSCYAQCASDFEQFWNCENRAFFSFQQNFAYVVDCKRRTYGKLKQNPVGFRRKV